MSTLLALTLGGALADDVAPSTQSNFASSLKQLASKGTAITLLAIVNGQSTVVATVNPDGTLNVTGDLQSATNVQVGETTYILAAKVTGSGTLFVTTTNAQGATVTLPLVAAIHQAAAHGGSEDKKSEDKKSEDKKPESKTSETEAPESPKDDAKAADGSGHGKSSSAPGKPPKPGSGGHH
ncbi:hypothetical protein [Deinococcus humi]|uniref:Uncharacterized protein n=1 Tax=Deinococcus humi TaxID=662880 RepID=A0A7W8K2K1_9DEIO|nr:hypothetical protein [Deinococcus humi]MBB5366408.1 hypothetical protein [Deinococcus humi]